MTQQREKPQPTVTVPPLPDGFEPTWRVYVQGEAHIVDGELVGATHVHLELWHQDKDMYRSVQYGAFGSEGSEYDAIAYYEGGGGGTVVLGYCQIGSDLYVGVVRQHRMLMGEEPVLVAAGGYKRPGESDVETGEREGATELGNVHLFNDWVELPGQPVNCNRAVFITAGPGEGVTFMAVPVNPEALVSEDGDTFVFDEATVRRAPDGDEKVLGTIFVPARVAIGLPDAFVPIAVARLLVHLGKV